MPSSQSGYQAPSRLSTPLMLLLVSPFFLNDFANIVVKDWHSWLLIDYLGVKLAPLVLIWWMIRGPAPRPADLGLGVQRLGAFWMTFLGLSLLGTFIDQNAGAWMVAIPGYAALGAMPEITSPLWNWIDLTFGLILVGVVEELVFRGCMYAYLSRLTRNPAAIVAGSALIFGLIHWSLGLHAVLDAALIGALFMAVYLKTRSLPALMLAHFAIDFIDYAGVIPKELFRLS